MSKIGKYIIENLTVGMYQDSKIVYREYIQNAADQIDVARRKNMFQNEEMQIDIIIDTMNRNILIKDNATGIAISEVKKKLGDVADSDKEVGVDKGFRGIGRLGGLAYCDTLIFSTSLKGEKVKTIMNWNAKKLLKLIQDKNAKDSAEEMLDKVITYETKPCEVNEHFFSVEMLGIRKENTELLDIEDVRKYISLNAPVPYPNQFIYRSKIYEFIERENLTCDEYKIYVNDEEVFKKYGTYLYEEDKGAGRPKKYDEIFDIKIKKFESDSGKLIAWLWYGICRFEKAIPIVNEMRGIRLRQSNIQLGDERTLAKLFKESRGYSYYIGEIHAISKELIPNARRDYFNENSTRIELEAQLEEYFSYLYRIYRAASETKSAKKKEISYMQKQAQYKEKIKNGFIDEKDRKNIEDDLENKKIEYEKAQKKLKNIREKTSDSEPLSKVIQKIEENYQEKKEELKKKSGEDKQIKKEQNSSEIKTEYVTRNLTKLDKKQQKLVARIYGIISDILPENMGQELINKIQSELSK